MRIHKLICYALSDVQYDRENWELTDERFQDWVRGKGEGNEALYQKTQKVEDFFHWVLDNQNEASDLCRGAKGLPLMTEEEKGTACKFPRGLDITFLWLLQDWRQKDRDWKWHEGAVHEPEFGDPKLFGFVPLENPTYYRSDNTIDYYESEDAEVVIKPLSHRGGVYPHSGTMFLKGYLPASEEFPRTINIQEFNYMTGQFDTNSKAREGPEKVKYLLENYIPEIPSSIMLWTHYLGIFKDWKKTINDFRPYIYTYWA